MEVAVTGYTGFIGQNLVRALLKQGHTVYPIGRDFRSVQCDRVYHLACPSTTEFIKNNPNKVMDIILDGTRKAMNICPMALFVNASSFGATEVADNEQGAYNIAKRCMEIYLQFGHSNFVNYRLPSVYGPDAHDDSFIKRCVNGTAYYPTEPTRVHYIAHINDVVDALINLTPLNVEEITLGQIYESFNSGRRGLHRPESS